MKILFINGSSADYVQDIVFSGLVKLLGVKNVVDYEWNLKYHLHYKAYPKNLGYNKNTFLSSVFRKLDFSSFDCVIVGCNRIKAFETYIKIVPKIPVSAKVVFIDGGDGPEIGADLKRYDLYELANSIRPFDIIFKREVLLDRNYGSHVFPLPIGFNFDRLPALSKSFKYDVSFWAVESNPVRTYVLEMLEDKFDCQRNGTTKNQTFNKYKRKGDYYLQELSSCKITLNFRGTGWDTMRYWEVPSVGGFMISQKPEILIPNNLEHEKEVVFVKKDISDLNDLIEFYLKNPQKREDIARRGRQKVLEYHSDVKRAEFILKTIQGF